MAAPREIDVLFLSAAKTGDMSMLQRLTEKYKNGDGPGKVCYAKLMTPTGYNALHEAAIEGRAYREDCCIEELKFDVNGTADESRASGDTALILSILSEHQRTTIFLIENGADVNKRNILGETPLHNAAMKGSKEIVKLLVSNGADLNAVSQMGTPLHHAAASENHAALKYLLDLKADPNPSILYNEQTPLFVALKAKARECVKLLLEAGANPNCSCYNATPLKAAACQLDLETIKCLLKAGADPNAQDPFRSKYKEFIPFAKAKAGEAFRRKSYVDAITWYVQAVATGEVDAKLLSNRSLCGTKLNLGNKALADAQACISLEPRWAKSHYREGLAWNVLKNFDKAVEAFSRALALDPGNKEIEKACMEA